QKGSRLGAAVGQQVAIALEHNAGMHLLNFRIAEESDVAGFGAADGGLAPGHDEFPARSEAAFDPQPRFLENDLGETDQKADAQAEDHQTNCQRAARQQVAIGQFKENAAHQAADDAADYTIDDLPCRRSGGLSGGQGSEQIVNAD